MQSEVTQDLTLNPVAPSSALYVLWGGANDYGGGQLNPAIPVGNILSEMTQLSAAGATQFLVVNLPDLGKEPATLGTPLSAGATALTNAHNALLAAGLAGFDTAHPTVTTTLLDVNLLFSEVIANPAAFGFTNVTQPYVTNQGGLLAPIRRSSEPAPPATTCSGTRSIRRRRRIS